VDIAYLHPGQKVIIKITAYDFTIYGGLDGKLMQISPDSLVDQNGNSYFMVYVETDQHFLGKLGNRLEIIPGMTVDVEILTGEKTILSYIMKPVLRAKSRAFTER
jgi:adhesin transport system membrane fusion protein